MLVTRRSLLMCGTALLIADEGVAQLPFARPANLDNWSGPLRPEWFGAKGDGRTNDTQALSALADFVNAHGGGEIIFRRTTYVVGEQRRADRADAPYSYEPLPILDFKGCDRPLIVRGNGARLRCADGLRFGTFDPLSGRPTDHGSPYYGHGVAGPYLAMIRVSQASGSVFISDFELDGNLRGLLIGGPYGDTGRQLPATGIALYDNVGSEHVRNVYSHHHALDGMIIDGVWKGSGTGAKRLIENVRCEYNCRQGCSITGGRGYRFVGCSFSHTGKAGIQSAPSAGVDVEAENGKQNRDLHFIGCTFSNNRGVGLLAAEGNNEGLICDRCRFIGTTNWGAWPHLPRAHFRSCTFVGPVVNAWGSEDKAAATQFLECTFLDDPGLSPTGELFVGQNTSGPITDLYDHPNVLFRRCSFRLTHKATLPWVTKGTIFEDCVMEQASPKVAYPRGTYIGRNIIQGNVDLYSARVFGDLIANGKPVPRS